MCHGLPRLFIAGHHAVYWVGSITYQEAEHGDMRGSAQPGPIQLTLYGRVSSSLKLLKHYLGFSLPVMVQYSVMQFTGSMTSQEAEHGDVHKAVKYIMHTPGSKSLPSLYRPMFLVNIPMLERVWLKQPHSAA
ncbi:uncharacterized protein LACBIDRAFT_328318 [Laccaria bicolor S238N-H82]|uniref:Predicted protein n=1 Tax=Laccaria bicolor (strain S238N-H82 / ATCC MYA-4686) TaxID=486041 RepID=B0DEI6_LACBS|nr:uncharacterized protein LACBIDRAFT_328318 [Laccaria bicolor S238N-H82]EDR06943.1 predicted protein [Laccaria bicolor S238N-H82]|eukprot:XP_001882316.1 predicted protein [Laccaria bicolor S238N-H82]